MLKLNNVTTHGKIFAYFQMNLVCVNYFNNLIYRSSDLAEAWKKKSIPNVVFLFFAFAFPYMLPVCTIYLWEAQCKSLGYVIRRGKNELSSICQISVMITLSYVSYKMFC